MSTSTAAFLGTLPLFQTLPRATLDEIAASASERRATRGDLIFREGEPCDGFWIVEHGSANILKTAPDGRRIVLESCAVGGMVGLASAIDQGRYPASAEAREDDTVLLYLPAPALLAAVERVPALGLAISKALARKLRGATGQVASVSLKSVRSRVAAYVLAEAEARGTRLPDGALEVTLSARQEELATRLGTVREVFARTLRSLREDGLIQQERDTVVVLDLARLRRVAGGPGLETREPR